MLSYCFTAWALEVTLEQITIINIDTVCKHTFRLSVTAVCDKTYLKDLGYHLVFLFEFLEKHWTRVNHIAWDSLSRWTFSHVFRALLTLSWVKLTSFLSSCHALRPPFCKGNNVVTFMSSSSTFMSIAGGSSVLISSEAFTAFEDIWESFQRGKSLAFRRAVYIHLYL